MSSTTKFPAARTPEPPLSENDRLAHEEASYVRRTAVVDSDPDVSEALRRVRGEQVPARTLTSYARRDVRNTIAKVTGW